MTGLFGAVIFQADQFLAKDMVRKRSGEWAEHKILNQTPILQLVGSDLHVFSLTVTFNARHTLGFEEGVALLESYVTQGLAFPLIIGYQLVGGFTSPEYVITKIESKYNITDASGFGLHSFVNLEFKQYRTTTTSSTGGILGNIGGILGSVQSTLQSAVGAITGLPGVITGVAQLSIPGVAQIAQQSTNAINTLVQAAPIAGVTAAVNAITSNAGSVVNGITSGTISPTLAGLQTMAGQNVANAVSLANLGGIQ